MWYTIESQDDWLSKIALRLLGDAQKWPLIYDINKDVIGNNPDRIQVGMRIWVPVDGKPKPSTDSGTTMHASSGNILYIGLAAVLAGASFLMLKK